MTREDLLQGKATYEAMLARAVRQIRWAGKVMDMAHQNIAAINERLEEMDNAADE